MKICWNTLEGMKLNNNGSFRKGTSTYIEMEACKVCCGPYLTKKYRQSKFCSFSCAVSGENNPFFGKTHTVESKRKMAESSACFIGSLNPNYKGGIKALGLAGYNTYKDKLSPYEDIRKQDGTEILEAKCVYCGQWHTPKYSEIKSRLRVVNKLSQGEGRLYCSENCKQACPTYGRQLYPKGFKHATSREVSTYLRQMVFERDDWTCQICGKSIKEAQLHCHHMDPVTQNPMFQNDIGSCITLCKNCHKDIHKQKGCRYVDLQCKSNENINKLV